MALGRVAGGTSPARRRPRPGAGRTGRAAGRGPFAALVVLILAGGLIALLLLNTALNQGSFQLTRLQQQTDKLTDERQGLQQQIGSWSAPDALSARARRLGMVPGGNPAFLRDDGTVLGSPAPIEAGAVPPVAQPTASPSASPSPSAKPSAKPSASAHASASAGASAVVKADARTAATASTTAAATAGTTAFKPGTRTSTGTGVKPGATPSSTPTGTAH
ncbi:MULTISPECIES: septum formation initiator family protein [Streptacidiphilus]|uniref:Septum formation initiator family protein n=1 Tax=Streptacidiphilus cavernicola TaxID=3342716 RepID=A0ABV6UXQ6_9ACTN|nr:septum formation initiator family protein [Streptacidiphilus jeojiense]